MKRPFLQFILHVQPCWQHSNWRKKHSLVFLVLLCLAFAFGSGVANADDTSLGWNGGGVQLIQNNNITMVSEHVNIRVGRWANVPTYASFNWSYVSCSFTFRNNSAKAQQVLMGFPDEYVPDPEFDGDRNANGTHLTDFTTQINGRVVPTQHLKNTNTKEPYAYWQEWKMQFQPQQTVVVRNTFWVGNTVSVLYGFTIDYILKTGRAWNGPIGRAEITVDLSRLPNCRVLT